MRIQWLGTAAAEGWPALFCQCDACMEAQRRGGRNIRSRSGALIDENLLIDLNPDLLYQKQKFHLDLGKVEDVIVTHFHSDHLTPMHLGLMVPVYAHRKSAEPIRVHASQKIISMLKRVPDGVEIIETKNGESFEAAGKIVTPLPAVHGGGPENQAQFYLIQKGSAGILYAHDTDLFCDEAWQILSEKIKTPLSILSVDCTNGPLPHAIYRGHMGFEQDVMIKNMLIEKGLADEKTLFVSNHFSHNGHVLYEEATERMKPEGFVISYDGMTAEAAE